MKRVGRAVAALGFVLLTGLLLREAGRSRPAARPRPPPPPPPQPPPHWHQFFVPR
jgi:hypothetical protein